MNILFRVDSATHIGIGHVMRCLTLAAALKEQGAQCHFVCRAFNGNMVQAIQEAGHVLSLLSSDLNAIFNAPNPQHAPPHANWLGCDWQVDFAQTQAQIQGLQFDWLVVDNYALDERWEAQARSFAKHIMVIDDLADRKHDCEVLLDQNLGRKHSDYDAFVPNYCQRLIGPKYALLRPEFAELRAYSLQRRQANPQLKKLLISLGGVDKDNVTGQVLTALKNAELPQDIDITVVMGASAPHLANVQAKAKQLPWQTEVVVNVNNMAQRMADADLAIGAAGSTSWERCCLGLPTLMLVLADNQKGIAEALAKQQAAWPIEIKQQESLVEALQNISSQAIGKIYSTSAQAITDGQGVNKVQQHIAG